MFYQYKNNALYFTVKLRTLSVKLDSRKEGLRKYILPQICNTVFALTETSRNVKNAKMSKFKGKLERKL